MDDHEALRRCEAKRQRDCEEAREPLPEWWETTEEVEREALSDLHRD